MLPVVLLLHSCQRSAEKLVVGQQVDGPAAGGGEQVRERDELLLPALREEAVRGGQDHLAGVSHGDDGRRVDAHLDRARDSLRVPVRRLVGDLQVDVDRLGGDPRRRGEQRRLDGLARPLVIDQVHLHAVVEVGLREAGGGECERGGKTCDDFHGLPPGVGNASRWRRATAPAFP